MSINPLNDISKVYMEQVALPEATLPEAKVDKLKPEHERATARDKRYDNPTGALELGGGVRRARRAAHRERDELNKDAKDIRRGKLDGPQFQGKTGAERIAIVKKAKGMKEEEITESHFKVGDEVICKASGMEGEVVKVDPQEKGKYYTVKREDGKKVKYAPDELKLEDEEENEDEKEEMKEAKNGGASKKAEAKFHKKLDTLVHKTFGKRPEEMKEEKPNDGNLANNYPPYDKVTRGDVIAGATGNDEMGGKKKKKDKKLREGFSNWRQDLSEVMTDTEYNEKITDKKIKNKIKTSAIGSGIKLGEAIEEIGGTLLEMVSIDEKMNLKTAEMGEVIKDFQTSDAPQFKGKTEEERRQMAIAAKLTAERGGKKLKEQQEDDGNESKEKQMLAKKKQMMQKQYMLDKMRLQAQQQGKLPTGHRMEETEVIDERRRVDKGKPRPAEPSAAFKAVSKMMGSSRKGVQPRRVKKEPGKKPPVAGEYGAPQSPAQKVAQRRAAAKRSQDMMTSRFD